MSEQDKPGSIKTRSAKKAGTRNATGKTTKKRRASSADDVPPRKKAGAARQIGRETGTNPAITIKKYANRRLYNTRTSRYVTLEDLAGLVRAGQEFSVLDAKSGEDITRSVLTQIIVEEEAKGDHLLPVSFLRQIIGLYGDKIQSFVPSYLEMTMENFITNREAMRNSLSQALANTPGFKLFEDTARQNRAMFEQGMKLFGGAAQAAPSPWRKRQAGAPLVPKSKEAIADPPAPEDPALRIAALEAEIVQLKRALARARGPSRTHRTRKP